MSQKEVTKRRRKPINPVAEPEAVELREEKKFGIHATFGIDLGFEEDDTGTQVKDANGKPVPKERDVTGFAEPGPETPKIDPGYVFPAEETKVLLLGLELKDRILLSGHTGTGKTSLVEQIAARLNYNVVKINFDGDISRADLIGEPRIIPNPEGSGSITDFQDGILPWAYTLAGTIIVLDEWDAISGECAFVLQRPLQKDDGKLLILEDGGRLLPMHPQNAIIATANTTGQGDETGLYSHGTRVQNYAQLNRFGLCIKMKYLDAEHEVKMLQLRCPDLSEPECQTLVRAVGQVREAYMNGELSAPLSPRDLINWGDKYVRMGDPIRAAKYCFLNRMPEEDHVAAEQIIQRSFAEA
jgi:cobaltochelatase CobS